MAVQLDGVPRLFLVHGTRTIGNQVRLIVQVQCQAGPAPRRSVCSSAVLIIIAPTPCRPASCTGGRQRPRAGAVPLRPCDGSRPIGCRAAGGGGAARGCAALAATSPGAMLPASCLCRFASPARDLPEAPVGLGQLCTRRVPTGQQPVGYGGPWPAAAHMQCTHHALPHRLPLRALWVCRWLARRGSCTAHRAGRGCRLSQSSCGGGCSCPMPPGWQHLSMSCSWRPQLPSWCRRCPNALAAVLAVCGSVLPQVAATPAPAFAGHTPLTYAAQFDSAGPLRQLLEAGALPPERVSHSGAQQPLSVALRAGRGEQAVLLLQLGGDVSGMDERGLTLLHWAADKRCGWKWSSR